MLLANNVVYGCPAAFLSMWISNTATTAMMMPIMEAVLIELEGATSTEVEDKSRTNIRKLLALSVLILLPSH